MVFWDVTVLEKNTEKVMFFQEKFTNTLIWPTVFLVKFKFTRVNIQRSIWTFLQLSIVGGSQILHKFPISELYQYWYLAVISSRFIVNWDVWNFLHYLIARTARLMGRSKLNLSWEWIYQDSENYRRVWLIQHGNEHSTPGNSSLRWGNSGNDDQVSAFDKPNYMGSIIRIASI